MDRQPHYGWRQLDLFAVDQTSRSRYSPAAQFNIRAAGDRLQFVYLQECFFHIIIIRTDPVFLTS